MWQSKLLWESYWVNCGSKSDTAPELVHLIFLVKMSPKRKKESDRFVTKGHDPLLLREIEVRWHLKVM